MSDIIRDLKEMFPYVREEVKNIKKDLEDKNIKITNLEIFYRLKDKFSGRCKLDIFSKSDVEEKDINIDSLVEELQQAIGIPYCELRIYADNARPEAIEEMKRAGFAGIRPCTKGDGSVLEGIEWLQDRTIYIDESCIGFKNETESYQWQKDKKTGERLPKPVKVNDDAEDSVRYSCEGFRNPKRFRITTF